MRRPFAATFVAAFLASHGVVAPLASAQFVSGHLFVSGWKQTIWEVDPTDPLNYVVTLFADASDGLNGASSLQYLQSGALLEANFYDSKVLSFDAAGVATTLWSTTDGLVTPFGENGIAATRAGDVYLSNYGAKQILLFPAIGGAPTVVADASDGIVHADGLASDAVGDLWVANRDGMNVIRIDRAGTAKVFDTLPDMPMSIAIRDNGDAYVACLYGDIYRYPEGDPNKRVLFLSFGRVLGTPVIRFDLGYHDLYMTSFTKGNLLAIDPDTAKYVTVLPDGTFTQPLSIEVVGERRDVGIAPYGVGTPGKLGFVPTLGAYGHPIFNDTVTIQIRDFVGGALATLVASTSKSSAPYKGGSSLINFGDVAAIIPIQLPGWMGTAGSGDMDWAILVPADPALDGMTYYVQVFAHDAAAFHGVSMTNGLRITFRAF